MRITLLIKWKHKYRTHLDTHRSNFVFMHFCLFVHFFYDALNLHINDMDMHRRWGIWWDSKELVHLDHNDYPKYKECPVAHTEFRLHRLVNMSRVLSVCRRIRIRPPTHIRKKDCLNNRQTYPFDCMQYWSSFHRNRMLPLELEQRWDAIVEHIS
jgi:hypothetical protein